MSSALHKVDRVFTDAHWRVIDLVAEGDTLSLRIRFTGARAGPPTAALCREGDYWSLDWAGAVLRLRHTRGLGYLHELPTRPGVEVHALQLAAAGADPGDTGHAGPLLDDAAKNAYRRRLADLLEEEADAQSCHDPERAGRARLETDTLTRQLAGVFPNGLKNHSWYFSVSGWFDNADPAGTVIAAVDAALAAAHTVLGTIANVEGDRQATAGHHERALAHARFAGDVLAEIRIRVNRSAYHVFEASYREALAELEIALRLADLTGSPATGRWR